MTRIAIIAAVALAAFGITAGHAATDEQFVYRPLVTDGSEYRRISYPGEAGEILVLAGMPVVIEARRAPVSYWPITREYIADLAQASPPIAGGVEVTDSSGATMLAEPETYVMWHAQGVGAGPAELVRGDAAEALHAKYLREARAAAEALNAYQAVVAKQRALAEEWLRMAGERGGKNMPPPPPEVTLPAPEPYRAYVSDPEKAAILSLKEGRYTIRMRGDDGEVIAGSQRMLVSFGPTATGTGYVIRPQDRWTQPSFSFAPGEVIYTTGRTDLFLQPLRVAEFRADLFGRLFRPQSVEIADRATPIRVPRPDDAIEAKDAVLVLAGAGEEPAAVPATGYRVAQAPNMSRGYTIEPFEARPGASLKPDFTAMRIGRDSGATSFTLADGANEEILPDSGRRLVSVRPPSTAQIFLPALLPLAIGLALRFSTRRKGKKRA